MTAAKKIALVLVMVFTLLTPAASVLWTDSTEGATDYSRYYYNQLDTDISRTFYNETINLDQGENVVTISYSAPEYGSMSQSAFESAISGVIEESIKPAVNALSLERPELFWINYETAYSSSFNSGTGLATIVATLGEDTYPANSVSSLNTAINGFAADTTSRYVTVRNIHDGIENMLTYSTDTASIDGTGPNKWIIRSAYTALVGDHNVVCEGYAKSFKMLCDKYSIPCIIVTGVANGQNHMYNYVMMDDNKWYMVDATWDDQDSRIYYDYLLAGTNTVGFTGNTVGTSHDTSLTAGYGFILPTLSANAYPTPTYAISFNSNGGSAVDPINVTYGNTASMPATDPVKSGFEFAGWYKNAALTQTWSWGTAVTGDVTLYAKWIENTAVTYTVSFNGNGTTISTASQMCAENDTVTLPAAPSRDGYTFVEWNTAADGNGTGYKSGSTFIVKGDTTLYAKWSANGSGSTEGSGETKTDGLNSFLEGEIIDGVSNKVLVIGGAVAIVALICVGFAIKHR